MKKLIMLTLILIVILHTTVTAYAVTPTLNIPDMPEISSVKITVNLDNDLENAVGNHVDNWLKNNPIDFSKFDFSKIKFMGFGD